MDKDNENAIDMIVDHLHSSLFAMRKCADSMDVPHFLKIYVNIVAATVYFMLQNTEDFKDTKQAEGIMGWAISEARASFLKYAQGEND